MAHLIRQRDRYQYPTIARVDGSTGRHYKVPGFEAVTSVTTILDRTKDKGKLKEWADRVGHEEAERIKRDAAYVGTCMHEVIEMFLADEPLTLGQDWMALRGQHMAFSLIRTYFPYIDVVYGQKWPCTTTTAMRGPRTWWRSSGASWRSWTSNSP